MDIYVYSDESGVFDYVHNDYFVFGGLLFLDKSDKEIMERKYIRAERVIRLNNSFSKDDEVKATTISNKEKNKLFRSLNNCFKFAVIVDQKKVLGKIYDNKKSKQRYMDYAYKICLKKYLQFLIKNNYIDQSKVDNIYINVDEHTTATDGRYELREGLLNEFKYGTFNENWNMFFPPLFTQLKDLKLNYCNSKNKTLVRAADIVSNKIYHLKTSNSPIQNSVKMFVTFLP